MAKIYQIRLWCSEDSCCEFWYDKELSDFYSNIDDINKELKKYENKTKREIERMCDCTDISVNRPRIVEFNLK